MKGESRLATSSVNDNGVFEVSFEGNVSAEDVRKAIRNQWSMGVSKSLWDLTRARTGGLSSDQIAAMAGFVEVNRPAKFRPGAVAFLVANDVDFGMMRMVEAYSSELDFESKVGRDRVMLEKWLAEPP